MAPASALAWPQAQRNAIQKVFLENSEHGIPISFVNEGLHGGAPGAATQVLIGC